MNTQLKAEFTAEALELDLPSETERIAAAIRSQVGRQLHRRGAVVGISGGIDSSLVTALCVKALGADRVFGIFMPEHDSSPESLELGQQLADRFGIATTIENISDMLEAAGCYRRRDEAIRSVFPEYGPGYRSKIVLSDLFDSNRYRLFSIVIEDLDGKIHKKRMPLDAYQTVVAATNFKQRVRKMMEYYHADRLRYAVAGTPNRLEYDQGFFVKNGDGSADFKPIAHLYKTQVYRLAEYLGVPEAICKRPPTTDTYSLAQSQEEFFFSLPYGKMDLCLYAKDHDIPADNAAQAVGLSTEQVLRVYEDIDAKRQAAVYLHSGPLTIDEPESL